MKDDARQARNVRYARQARFCFKGGLALFLVGVLCWGLSFGMRVAYQFWEVPETVEIALHAIGSFGTTMFPFSIWLVPRQGETEG